MGGPAAFFVTVKGLNREETKGSQWMQHHKTDRTLRKRL
jgi:hypothetical protein